MRKILAAFAICVGMAGMGHADTKISAMMSTTTLNGSDILPVVVTPGTNPLNRKITYSNFQLGMSLPATVLPSTIVYTTGNQGSVPASVLPSTVAYLNANQQWSAPQTFGSSVTVTNAVLMGAANQTVTVSSNTILPGATFYAGAGGPIETTNMYSTFFGNPAAQSIYGNFIGSATVTNASSMTISGLNTGKYTHYIIRLDVNNATGSNGTVFMRSNNNTGNNYGYSLSGFTNGVSTGTSCNNNSAAAIALTNTGGNQAQNEFSSGANVWFTATLNLDQHIFAFLNGTVSTTNAATGIHTSYVVEGSNNDGISSLQVWVGSSSSCTSITDPLTGTTGTIEVWGVF